MLGFAGAPSLLLQVSLGPAAAQGCAGEDWGSLRVFRKGLLLAWKEPAAHSIVQTLSMHPKNAFPESKLPGPQAAKWQTAPEGWQSILGIFWFPLWCLPALPGETAVLKN